MSSWPTGVRFRPIEQWPGELHRIRKASPFRAAWGRTLQQFAFEIRQLKAKNVVIQVAMREQDIRVDGYPRADRRPTHPGVIVSMDTPHGPLSYPCDTYWDWTDNLRAIVLTLENLRAVDRYGVSKRGEQYTGWSQLPPGRPMPKPMTLDEAAAFLAKATGEPLLNGGDVLWEPGKAHAPSVERAYRMAAKRLHPDSGGSTEEFQRLQEAKRVLDGAR